MKIKILFIIILIFGFFSFSNQPDLYSTITELKIQLKWNKAYTDDSIDKSLIGLKWALSFVGATLPTNNENIIVSNDTLIDINLKKLGFSIQAEQKVIELVNKIKKSEEYQKNKSVDMGRFVSLLLGSSRDYYEIIGTPSTLKQLLANYQLLPSKGYINNSMVASTHRLVQFSKQNGLNQLYISTELDSISGKILEYETIEIISNGQLRFGIFDENGIRIQVANSKHTAAGKPAKCMWCHESALNPLFSKQKNLQNYLTETDLQDQIKSDIENLKTNRNKLVSEIDFNQKQQHTYTELLYISFMEPSAKRLSLEWKLPIEDVEKLLSGLPTHVYKEFPFLGNLYHRNEVEKYAPYKSLSVSGSIREFSNNEVNHLN